jgi:hypothetical protein
MRSKPAREGGFESTLMTSQFGKAPSSYPEWLRSRILCAYRARTVPVIILAVSPPLICAWFATGPDRWNLFERSGSLTTAIGLLLASRRYLGHGVLELAIGQKDDESRSSMIELVENIHAAKLGLALSAFGTITWGWGKYLGWWSFSYLVVWAVIAAYDAWRDFVRLRDTPIGVPPAE